MTMRGTGLTIAVLALGGCCGSERISDTGYASMTVYGPQISACILDGDCARLCADRFGLDADVEIVRCEITSIDRQAPGASSGASIHRDPVLTRVVEAAASAPPSGARGRDGAGAIEDLSLVVGVRLRVTYLAPAPCEFAVDVGAGDDGWSDDSGDDSSDDGSTDDYPDDGSDDDPDDDSDDGSDDYPDDGGDDGSDDGGGDDGGGDDGGGDDGGGDDGGGDDGGWGGTRGGGARSVYRHAEASDHRPAGAGVRIGGEQASVRAR